jgi:hypothetical protein
MRIAPPNLPRIELTSIDWRVLAFAATAGLAAVVLFGVMQRCASRSPS